MRLSKPIVGILSCVIVATFLLPSLSAKEPVGERSQKRVLIIGMDGTRPDALAKAKTPTFDRLIREGAFTDEADILGTRYQKNDTISGPGWSSILTGVWADKHGVHDNKFKGKNYELFPHFFKRLKRQRPDAKTASLVSWGPIHEHILSEADIAEVFPLPRGKTQSADLRVSADKLKIDTRDGKWHHLLATRQKDELKLYLDGKLIDTLSGVDLNSTLEGDFYYLGRDSRTGQITFEGQLDDVRLWKRSLTAEEIAQTAANGPSVNRKGLLAEYLFEDQFADTAGHSEGPFPAKTLSKTASVKLIKGSSGSKSQALDLPTAGDKTHGLRIPLSDPLRDITRSDFTVETRFRTTDKGRSILLGNYNGKAGALNLELHENNSVRVYFQRPNPQDSGALAREGKRDKTIAEKAARILREEDPTALFVYFHQTDATGHAIGFSPQVPEYITAIENIDARVNRVLKAMQSRPNFENEDWLTIICTDHGGLKRSHSKGLKVPEIRRVFLIAHGPSVQPGRIPKQAYLVDVTATALAHLLGSVDPQWQLDGKAVGLKMQN
ncbi:LamG-like jellyroll fold domain-containing protein [uncultured Gimesia sp.]|uniref:LamG-like jellyroll fold domain-containing protein n=1 Tax=uncultured Gimesia sp. TaxID=1678688 RepID=UPI0030DBD11C|tara:strand:+ start:333979 stop:335637 length:1659 start_codon:yes stop_codon:yes gene_type:complete